MVFHIGIVSSGRPNSVQPMMAFMEGLEADVHWYVKAHEKNLYSIHGAENVIGIDGSLVDQRNAVLENAFAQHQTAVLIDDDLKSLAFTRNGKAKQDIPMRTALDVLRNSLLKTPFKLAGPPPYSNLNFYRPKPVTQLYICSFMIVFPSLPRFDPRFLTHEDADFSLQHICQYGGALRVPNILADFRHGTNPGGCVSYRTKQMERDMTKLMEEKWSKKFNSSYWQRFYRKGIPKLQENIPEK